MTKSVRSVNVLVRLDFIGHDVGDDSINEAIANINYSFHYDDDYLRLVNSEIVDVILQESVNPRKE